MQIIRKKDTYNSIKVWVIKRTECGHYYYNQEINGKLINKAFHKTTLDFLGQLLNFDNQQITRWFVPVKDSKAYEVAFNVSGRYGTTERFNTLKSARKAVIDFINDMRTECRLTGARGFVRLGSAIRDNSVWIEHKAFGVECSAYISRLNYSNQDGYYTTSL